MRLPDARRRQAARLEGRHPESRTQGLWPDESPSGVDHGVLIASNAYTVRYMADLYAVEVESEVRVWLEALSDRDFGRVDFLVGLLAEEAETLGEPYARHLKGRCVSCAFTSCASRLA